MDLTTFGFITGVATLVSLVLQVSGLARENRGVFSYSTAFLAGVTVGLTVNTALSLRVALPEGTTARQLAGLVLFGGSGVLVFVLFVLSAAVPDESRRKMARSSAAAVSGFLIFLLLFFVDTFFK